MKITAEFNSNEELLSFINTFGAKTLTPVQQVVQAPVDVNKKEEVKETITIADTKDQVQEEKDTTKNVDAEIISEGPPSGEIIDVDSKSIEQNETPKDDEPKITKEMVRERLGAIMKSGKQKEAKELVAKYGASKIPELKEKDYAAVYKEAEALL